MKFRRVIVLVILAILLLFTHTSVKKAAISALFLFDILKGTDGIFAYITKEPDVLKVQYPSSIRKMKADLYLPLKGKRAGGIVLVHGLVDTGKDDPRLIHLAKSLTRAGWVTLVPDFEGMRSFKIRLTDIDEIVDSFNYLSSLDMVKNNKVCLLGFSYGAGPTLLAAQDERIRDKVNVAVSFGGYYDSKNLIMFVTTGAYDYKGNYFYRRPMDYAKWAFLESNIDFITNENDRIILKEISAKKLQSEGADMKELAGSLGPEGRIVYELITNKEPKKVGTLISDLNPELREIIERLSLKGKMNNIKAQLFLIHGKDDDAIPYTESLKMAEEFWNKERLHLYILDIFMHVDPSKRKTLAYIPSFFKFYSSVYSFMGFM